MRWCVLLKAGVFPPVAEGEDVDVCLVPSTVVTRIMAPDAETAAMAASTGRWACAVSREGDRWLAAVADPSWIRSARERFPGARVVSLELATRAGMPREIGAGKPVLLVERAGERLLAVVIDTEGIPSWLGSCAPTEDDFLRLLLRLEEQREKGVSEAWAPFPLEETCPPGEADIQYKRLDGGLLERGLENLREAVFLLPEEVRARRKDILRKKSLRGIATAGLLAALAAGGWMWMNHQAAAARARASAVERETVSLSRRAALLEKLTGWAEIEKKRPRLVRPVSILTAGLPPGWRVVRVEASPQGAEIRVSPPKDRPVSPGERRWVKEIARKLGNQWRVRSWKEGYIFLR